MYSYVLRRKDLFFCHLTWCQGYYNSYSVAILPFILKHFRECQIFSVPHLKHNPLSMPPLITRHRGYVAQTTHFCVTAVIRWQSTQRLTALLILHQDVSDMLLSSRHGDRKAPVGLTTGRDVLPVPPPSQADQRGLPEAPPATNKAPHLAVLASGLRPQKSLSVLLPLAGRRFLSGWDLQNLHSSK